MLVCSYFVGTDIFINFRKTELDEPLRPAPETPERELNDDAGGGDEVMFSEPAAVPEWRRSDSSRVGDKFCRTDFLLIHFRKSIDRVASR